MSTKSTSRPFYGAHAVLTDPVSAEHARIGLGTQIEPEKAAYEKRRLRTAAFRAIYSAFEVIYNSLNWLNSAPLRFRTPKDQEEFLAASLVIRRRASRFS